ncbi:MAG: gamma-butyrobetaine hydroxylase-like domain-containing protein [Beijerinckiaceae bacterium]
MSDYWPTELRLVDGGSVLAVAFDNGETFDLSAEYLRVMSPSAEVQGHSPAERKTVGGKRNVKIADLETIGNYAVRLEFDDKHGSGIFTWDYLAELGKNRQARWTAYMDELKQKGLDRDKPGMR